MVVAVAHLFRHGQRSPYPPPLSESAAGPSIWTSRLSPPAESWNLTASAFDAQHLTPHGAALLRHLGQYLAVDYRYPDPCAADVTLIADGTSFRDVQSARAFAGGFFGRRSCSAARAAAIVEATAAAQPLLLPLVSDDVEAGCAGPSEADVLRSFGGDVDALAAAYKPQIDRVGSLLGCCSAEVCDRHGLGRRNCSLSDLPHTFHPGRYYSYFDGALSIAGYYADAWMLQAVSGVEPFAWGELTLSELSELYRVHQRVMWLGASLNASRGAARRLAHALCSSDS
mmetsp:Transcript_24515/g.79826  ORF Transcript_24515/g.79826 Transcript_24515/m.79826 type:complete len:284 (-) Transcript_24515:1022-1873(-)